MFLALGVGAWSAAIFHFMIHAFFKALLFLSAGVVIDALHHERDMFKMGGLRLQLPFAFWSFLIGAASLSALPLVTAGVYSKDLILWAAWNSGLGSPWLWAAGLLGALLTSVYAFRMVFLTFYGKANSQITCKIGLQIKIPLIVLSVLSLIVGFINIPETLGDLHLFSAFIGTALPMTIYTSHSTSEGTMQYISGVVALVGVFIAYIFFLYNPHYAKNFVGKPFGYALHCFFLGGWNFDRLYDTLFVRPFARATRINKRDAIDLIYHFIELLSIVLNHVLSGMQNGLIRRYALGLAVGAIVIIGMVVLL